MGWGGSSRWRDLWCQLLKQIAFETVYYQILVFEKADLTEVT